MNGGTYNVAKLPDIDGDGVPEMLVAHGGDGRIPSTVCLF